MDNEEANEQQMPVEEDDEDDEDEDDNHAIGNPNAEDEEDEDDEDDDEPMEDDDDDNNPNQEDVLEGGVAEGDESRTLASEADIVLFFLCAEQFKDHPDHPILRPGVKVRIGLGKNTRLSAVMQRYVEVCNQVRSDESTNPLARIDLSDLEFVHAAVLKGQDTAEQGALMKDDVVRVRQNRIDQVEREKEANRLQRESDFEYLEQLRRLVDNQDESTVILDCQGGALPKNRNLFSQQQHVQGTKVRCNEVVVSKRCPWLGRLIREAMVREAVAGRPAERSKSVVSLPEPIVETQSPTTAVARRVQAPEESRRVQGDSIPDDDDIDEQSIQVLEFDHHPSNRSRMQPNIAAPDAAQIESDDDSQHQEEAAPGAEARRERTVVIPNHPPEAVRLLMEYCCTNRVVCLGHEAFRLAAKTKPAPREGKGNLPPYGTKRWTNRGEPTIPFEWAAAGIVLAEEASMQRFSLMCEMAASHLVSPGNVVDALTLCKRTQDQWGNPLQRLRRSAMEVVFHSKAYGFYESLYKQASFREAIEEKAPLLVPALFTGTADAVEECLGKKRCYSYCERDWKSTLNDRFQRLDREDKVKRAQERARHKKAPENREVESPLIVDELDALGNDAALRKTMKRLRGHSSRSFRRAEKRERRGSH